MTFRHLGVGDGLSQSSVLAISQDRMGNIWMGTRSGLNVYDGYGFRTYHAGAPGGNSLPDSNIQSLLMGSDGRMWVVTATGLCCYDFAQGRFLDLRVPECQRIRCISEEDGRLLLGSEHGLWIYEPETGAYERDSFIADRQVHSVLYRNGIRMTATDKGLAVTESGVSRYEPTFEGMDIYAIEQIGGTGWWIGTYGHGLYRTDSRMNVVKHYDMAGGDLPSDYIRVMKTDGYGRLWVGTYDGLAVFDDVNGRFRKYIHDDTPSSISHNSIRDIFVDDQKGVWLGTWFGGANYWNRQNDKLRSVPLTGPGVYGFVSCLTQDSFSSDIWVGTNDDGIWRYSPESGYLERINMPGASGNIKCISTGSDGKLYAGAHLGGLIIFTRDGKKAATINVNSSVPLSNSCYSLLESHPGYWWVGTLEGLMYYNSNEGRIGKHPAARLDPRLERSLICCLLRDGKGRIWIGSDAGLMMMPPEGDRILGFRDGDGDTAFPETAVHYILEDKSGTIWAATDAGLLQYLENGSFRAFTTADGLPNDRICALLDDGSGKLWITTGGGLCSLDTDNWTFRTAWYSPENEYNEGACCAGSDGFFNFGGLSGITRFRPRDMISNPFSPQPYITSIDSGTGDITEVERSPEGGIMRADISQDTNMFSISYSVFNPFSFGNNRFSYSLEGFDDSWHETSSRQVSYTNLPPGRYTFRLKSANSEGSWCRREVTLDLRVRPHWWQTRAAGIIWGLLALALIFAIIGLIINYIRTRLQLSFERAERLQIEDNLKHTRELMLQQYSGTGARESVSADEEFLRRAVSTVEENIDNENFSSSDFADAMCMSRSKLYLKINAITGESAAQFIRKVRFKRACELISEHKYSMAEISSMVGFSSPSYFATSFKKYVGVLPTEYARDH